MEKNKGAVLFRGLSEQEAEACLKTLGAREKKFDKGSLVLRAGDITDEMGIVLSGSVVVESNDLWGNRTVLEHVGSGGSFAESFAMMENQPLAVDVRANEATHVLLLAVGRLRTSNCEDERWARVLATNLLSIAAQKNFALARRSYHTTPKTIRGRVLSYLNEMAVQTGTREFSIPFDRQQLADYLNVDRSALSKELSKMRNEGLIDYHKSSFKVLSPRR